MILMFWRVMCFIFSLLLSVRFMGNSNDAGFGDCDCSVEIGRPIKTVLSMFRFTQIGVNERRRPTCTLDSYCPPSCQCTDGVIDCRYQGLTKIPFALPSHVTELWVLTICLDLPLLLNKYVFSRLEHNQIKVIPPRAFARYKKLRRMWVTLLSLQLNYIHVKKLLPQPRIHTHKHMLKYK